MNEMNRPDLSLEPDAERVETLTRLAMGRVKEYFNTLSDQKVNFGFNPDQIKEWFDEPLPKEKSDFEGLLKKIFDQAVFQGTNLPSPGYLAYIPVASNFETAISDYISKSINPWPGMYQFSPAFVEIERVVVSWLCEMMGMPRGSSGILTSGGSLANFTAVFTARCDRLPEEFWNGTLYVSNQAHHSILKAAKLAGFPKKSVKLIETDSQCRIDLIQLEAQIQSDAHPFMLIGNAGTTNTGAVDDLSGLAKIAKKHGLWFHVDAAWAGAFRLTQRGKEIMQGIEEADSITFDPHKALYTSFGSGALLVKDIDTLKKAHSMDAIYLPSKETDQEEYSPSHISPELSRATRGLQIWLPLKSHGIGVYKNLMEEKLQLADWATSELEKIDCFEIVTRPQVSLVTFTYKNSRMTPEEIDEANRQILEKVNEGGRVMLSGTLVHGRFVMRLVPFGLRTHRNTVEIAIDLLKAAVAEI